MFYRLPAGERAPKPQAAARRHIRSNFRTHAKSGFPFWALDLAGHIIMSRMFVHKYTVFNGSHWSGKEKRVFRPTDLGAGPGIWRGIAPDLVYPNVSTMALKGDGKV